jgi:hypothetical protein
MFVSIKTYLSVHVHLFWLCHLIKNHVSLELAYVNDMSKNTWSTFFYQYISYILEFK